MTFNYLMIEKMLKLFIGHSASGIFYRDFYIISSLCGRNVDPTLTISKLSGVVGQSVQHKQSKHTVGLYYSIGRFHIQFYTLHLERCATLMQHIKQRLQWETLNMQAKFALAQLNPVCKHIVIRIDLVDKFANIRKSFVAIGSIILKSRYLVYHSVDERSDVTNQRYFSTLLKIASLIILNLQHLRSQLLTLLLECIIWLVILSLPFVQIVKQPQREQQQHNSHDYRY